MAPSRAELVLLKVMCFASENRVFQLKENIVAIISGAFPSSDMDCRDNISYPSSYMLNYVYNFVEFILSLHTKIAALQ